jgi:hypothetical protein
MEFAHAQIIDQVTEASTGPSSYTPALLIIIVGTIIGGYLLAKLINRHNQR